MMEPASGNAPIQGVFFAVVSIFIILPFAVIAIVYTRRSKTSDGGDDSRRDGTTQKSSHYVVHKQRERTQGAEQILITGGAGFLGSHLVDELLRRRQFIDVHVFDVRVPKRRSAGVASYIRGDVIDFEQISKALVGMDTVFHVAGVSSHDLDVAVTKEMTYKVNVIGTENVVRACRQNGVKKLIFTSTCIATLGKNDRKAEGWTEAQPYPDDPVNEYVSSKIAAEKVVLDANGCDGLTTCVVRPAGMFGIGDNIMADMAVRGKDNYYIGDGTARLDVIDVHSAVHGHICAAEHLSVQGNKVPVAAGKTYNITGGKPVMYKEFFGGLCTGNESFWGHRPPKKIPVWLAGLLASVNEIIYNGIGYVPFARSLTKLSVEMTQRTYWFDNSLAAKEIGFSPLKSWRNAVDDVVKEYRLRRSQELKENHESDGIP